MTVNRCAGCDAPLDDGRGFRILGQGETLVVCRPSCVTRWWWRKRVRRKRVA